MSDLRARLAALSPEQRRQLQDRLGQANGGQAPEPSAPTEQAEPGRPPTPPPGPGGGGAPRAARSPGWSLFFFSSDHDQSTVDTYDLVLRSARFAAEHGFEAVWMPERHFDPFGAPYPDPAVLGAAVATATRRIRIRAGSVVLPLHDPLVVAERWAMVDNLSRGRVDVSLASGWHSQDFSLSPATFEPRKRVLAERLTELRTLWAGGTVERTEGTGGTVRLGSYPRPVQPELETWLTSSGNPATWSAAGDLGCNVLTALLEQGIDDLAGKADLYRSARADRGLPPDAGKVTLMLHTLIGEDAAQVRELARPPLQRYLRSHIDLFEKLVRARGLDINLENVTEGDKQVLVDVAFERYFTTNGLFGTPQTALSRVAAMVDAGVTEIACLIDFGVPHDTVLAHLEHLARLKDLADRELAAQPVPAG